MLSLTKKAREHISLASDIDAGFVCYDECRVMHPVRR